MSEESGEPKEPTEAEEDAADEAAADLADRLEGELVDVTTSDIMIGEPGSPAHCPVAHAVRRAISKQGHADPHVFVSGRKIACKVAGLPTISFALPSEVARWINRFDADKFVDTISFDLETYSRERRRPTRRKRWPRKQKRVLSWALL